MSDAVRIVIEFLDVLSRNREGLDEAPRRFFTARTVWENVGVATTVGIDEAIAFNRRLEESKGVAALRVETLAIAQTNGRVLTERIDHMLDAAGGTLMTVRGMGIFEVDDGGKITEWRDYFDTASMNGGGA